MSQYSTGCTTPGSDDPGIPSRWRTRGMIDTMDECILFTSLFCDLTSQRADGASQGRLKTLWTDLQVGCSRGWFQTILRRSQETMAWMAQKCPIHITLWKCPGISLRSLSLCARIGPAWSWRSIRHMDCASNKTRRALACTWIDRWHTSLAPYYTLAMVSGD